MLTELVYPDGGRADGARPLEPAPTGEVRWQTTARAERKAMIDEGLIVSAPSPASGSSPNAGRPSRY